MTSPVRTASTTPQVVLAQTISALTQPANNSGLNASSVWATILPDELPANPAQLMCSVALGLDGTFDTGLMIGGGAQQIAVQTDLLLNLFSSFGQSDQAKIAVSTLTNATLGIWPFATNVLKDILDPNTGAFDPLDSTGSFNLLKSPAQLTGIHTLPLAHKGRTITAFQLVFGVEFDWSLG